MENNIFAKNQLLIKLQKKVGLFNLVWIVLSYLGLIYITLQLITVFNLYQDQGIFKIIDQLPNYMQNHPLGFEINNGSLKMLGFALTGLTIFWLYKFTTDKNYLPGKEHGSASWGHKSDIIKIADTDNEMNNIIFTKTEKMSLDTRMTRKNLNKLIVGGSGSGKTRFFCLPNIMQMNSSLVVTDPKAELLRSTGKMLEENGYKIKVFNLIDMRHSFCYNPFEYIREDKDVLKLVNNLIKNTNPVGMNVSADPFWVKSETALLTAIFYLLYHKVQKDEQNLTTVMELLRNAEVKEDNEEFESKLDMQFKKIQASDPNHICVQQYAIFKQAAGKTAKSILISVGVRLAVFNIRDVAAITLKDNIALDEIGNTKTALFVVIPDSDDSYNFLVSMMYSQIFDTLYFNADFKNNGRLPIHVHLILDEFANIGQIPGFDKLVATMRSREISVSVIIQNMAQLKSLYKDTWENITGNCDSVLFLGGKELSTLEYISKTLGKQTIYTKTSSVTHGRNRSSSLNYGIHGRDLITPDEIGLMPDSDCILLIRGIKPFKSKKYIINEHVNYPQLGDGNKNNFDYRNIVTEVSEEDVIMMYALREPEPEPQEEFFPIKDLAFTTYELDNLQYEVEYEN